MQVIKFIGKFSKIGVKGQKKLLGIIILMSLILLITISFAFATDPAGGAITIINTYTGNEIVSENTTTTSGNLTNMNLDSTAMSAKGVAFFGNISGGIKLADSSDNKFYDWIVSDVSGSMLYASDSDVANWASLDATNSTNMPAFLETASADSYNNTFTVNESQNFNSNPINANYVITYNSSEGVGFLERIL